MKCVAMILSCYTQHYMPPVQYDFEPMKPVQVETVSTATVNAACHMDSLACAKLHNGHWMIVISDELKGEFRSIILRHEKAHVNGWIHGATDAMQ